MHLKHLLATTLLAILSGSTIAQDLPNLNGPTLNNGNLGIRDIPQNMDSTPSESETPSSTPSESHSPISTSTNMATSTPTSPASSWMPGSSTTPSTLQSSTRPSSSMAHTSQPSSAYASSTPVSSSDNMLGGLLGEKGLHLRAVPTPAEGVVNGYLRPAYQPAARPT